MGWQQQNLIAKFWGGERVCRSVDLAQKIIQIADFNNNFSRFADRSNKSDGFGFWQKTCADYGFKGINLAELRICQWETRHTRSKRSTDLARKLCKLADPSCTPLSPNPRSALPIPPKWLMSGRSDLHLNIDSRWPAKLVKKTVSYFST